MHSLFFLLSFAALLLMCFCTCFVAFLFAVAVINNAACDADALVALNSGNAPPYNGDTGPPIAADQAADGYLLMTVLQVAGDSVEIVGARRRAVSVCCGNEKYGVNRQGVAPLGSVIDHACSSMGVCNGLDEHDDPECHNIMPM